MAKSSSRIEEAFDGSLGSFDELRWMYLDGVYALVWSHEGVKARTHFFHDGLHMVERQLGTVHRLIVGIHKGYQMLSALHHEAFADKRQIVELSLDFFGIYILPGGAQYHRLGATFDKQSAVSRACPHVACMQPAVLVKDSRGCLRILIVPFHDVFAADAYLARDVLGVGTVDAAVHLRDCPAA